MRNTATANPPRPTGNPVAAHRRCRLRIWRLTIVAALLAAVTMLSGGALIFAMSDPASAATSYSPITINQNNWSGLAGYGSRAPALVEDSQGVVHLEGALRQTSTSGSIANLLGWTGTAGRPDAYAPPGRTVYTIAHTLGGTYADVAIDSNGEIWLIPSPNTNPGFVSLEGITYPTFGPPGLPVHLLGINTPDWYSYTWQYNYGASTASWWEDANHLVHLMGGVQQVATSGPNPTLIGWLPAWAAPASNVYTIAHTLGGTYADLSISTSGSIWLIPSANTNPGFVSLEGVTYYLGAPWQSLSLNPPQNGQPGFLPTNYYGNAYPAWYLDNDGIVHLEGGVLGPPGQDTTLILKIGQLSSSAAPPATVFTIAHTLGGTYADLEIDTAGNIWLLPWSHPDTGYVSLDGIQFSR